MATTYTVTGNLLDALGKPADAVITRVLIQSNLDTGDALQDTTKNATYLFPRDVAVTSVGGISLDLPATNATDLNVAPNTLRYQVVVFYMASGQKGELYWKSGWWALTTNSNLATLAAGSDTSPIVVGWRDGFTEDMAEVLGQAEAARAGAQAALSAAQALVIQDLGTSDGQMTALINASGSATKAALSATFVTATITGDPEDPDVSLYLNGVEL